MPSKHLSRNTFRDGQKESHPCFAEGARALILTRDLDEACALASRIAPEHLELSVENPNAWLPKLGNAGRSSSGAGARRRSATIAPGRITSCRPPDRALSSPLGVTTSRSARASSRYRRIRRQAGRIAATLAEGEGLTAHARSAQMRFK